ncbi:MAG: hypothetical protein Q4G68_12750 [Planctomycetia bacterium]|nr:hypothetical protein [Planctomycetia bacterium]
MPNSLFQYEMLPTTWFYVSGLMLLATFFRFNRFWSVRNLDILGLILFSPGLLYISTSVTRDDPINSMGYLWLMGAGCYFFLRLMLDPFMVRRPLLEPNLSSSGVTFACVTLLAFLVANVIVNRGPNMETARTLRLEQILTFQENHQGPEHRKQGNVPGYPPFLKLTEETNQIFLPEAKLWEDVLIAKKVAPSQTLNTLELSFLQEDQESANSLPETKGRLSGEDLFLFFLVLLIQTLIVLTLVLIGHCHFGNIKTGVAAAMFYLLLPYASQITGALDHIVPALLLLLAVLLYRRPMLSGIMLGMAGSLVFYPFFLIPLWASFYWQRGLFRFLLGTFSAIMGMMIFLLTSPETLGTSAEQVSLMFGHYSMRVVSPDGFWHFCPTIYRIPIITLFGVICFGLLIWPTRKTLATLISCSALLMLGVQFWMGNQGGLYMAWYLPLLILTVFRPNLDDRVASGTVVQ